MIFSVEICQRQHEVWVVGLDGIKRNFPTERSHGLSMERIATFGMTFSNARKNAL